MIKIVASHSMKVPADAEYSSKSFHVGLEAEVADSLGNEEGILAKTRELFALARAAVVRELNGKTPAVTPGPNGTTPQTNPGNGGNNSNGAQASPKQLQFLVSLARKNGGIKKLQEYVKANLGVDDLKLMTKKQASALIETLKGAGNGK